MAKKEISIILRAKNSMAAGLGKAAKSLKAFGGSAMRIGGLFAKAFLAAGVAIAGFAAKAIAAYAVQETAERSLIAAMNAHGEAGEALIPSLKRVAAAIQDETGAADESTLAGMAKMRMLGVQTSKLGEAAKGVIALKAVGLEEESAQKAVAMAMQGSYDMLNRYLPALRMTKDETEKANIVNEFFVKGYKQQKEVLNTVKGQWGLLKGRMGDVMEAFGRAIAGNDDLMSSLKRAGEAVKEFGAKIDTWVEGGGVIRLIAQVKLFYVDVKKKFQLIGNSATIMWSAIGDGGETITNYISNVIKTWANATKEELKYIGNYAKAIWKSIKTFSKIEPPDTTAMLQADAKFYKALAGSSGIATKRTEAAYAERVKIHADAAEDEKEILAEQTKDLIKQVDEIAAARKAAAEAEKKAAEAATAVVEKETDKQKKAKLKLLNDELSVIKKQKAAVEALAKSRVQAVIDKARAAKDEAESRAQDAAKAGELAGREKRGTKLSRKDKEFLDAFNKIEAAKAKSVALEAAAKSVEGKIGAEKALKVQEGIKADLDAIKQQNAKLLTYSG